MKKKNCIIVGLGRIGLLYDSGKLSKKILTHAKAVDNSKKFNLLAGVDNNPKSLKIFKKRFNKSLIFNNVNKLNFKQKFKIDLVIIATPAHTHYTLCKKIIAKIKPKVILCEKPLERNYIKGKKLIELAKKNNVKLKVNFIRRCDPSANKILKIIKKETKYKTIFHGTVRYSKGLLENGSHFIDLIVFWFGKVKKIQIFSKTKHFDYDFVLHFDNAKITFLSCSIKKFENFSIELFLANLRLRYDMSGEEIYIQNIVKDKNVGTRDLLLSHKKTFIKSNFDIYQKNVLTEVEKVFNNYDSKILSTGEEALYILKLIDSIKAK